MSSVLEDLQKIDYDALSRMVARQRYELPSTNESITSADEWPLPHQEDLFVDSLTDVGEQASLLSEQHKSLVEAGKTYQERRMLRLQQWSSELNTRNLEAQSAILDKSHPIYQVVLRVAERIADAERILIDQHPLSRSTTTDSYDIAVTRRGSVGAYTYPLAKAVIFESGLFTTMNDYFLREKGYCLAEDHIALVLAHEISHSDVEAEHGFLNEEYCDVQGMILGAKAGYNPTAAVDVEDFLIWYSENSFVQRSSDPKEQEKQHVVLPSHPDPKNRRQVLINVLQDETRVLPNQAKPYTSVDSSAIEAVVHEMNEWQLFQEELLLPIGKEQALANISHSTTLTELIDAMIGYQLQLRAEIAAQLSENDTIVSRVTLMQAIVCELNKRYKTTYSGRVHPRSPDQKGLSKDVRLMLYAPESISRKEGYGSEDIMIGGLAAMHKRAGTLQGADKKIEQLSTEFLQELDEVGWRVSSDIVVQSYQEDEAVHKARVRNAKMDAFILEDQVQKLMRFIARNAEGVDVARLISGDFSQHQQLGQLLEAVGITNFENYLEEVKATFRKFTPGEGTSNSLSPRARELFIDPSLFSSGEANKQIEKVRELLEETKCYRTAIIADRYFPSNQYPQQGVIFDDVSRALVERKLAEFAQNYSESPEEQQLYHAMMVERLVSLNNSGTPYHEQIASSTKVNPNTRQIDSRFPHSPVSDHVANLRIAPAMGGDLLKSFLIGNRENHGRSGYDRIEGTIAMLGRSFDFINLYKGECVLEETSASIYFPSLNLKLTDSSFETKLRLINKRKATLPVSDISIEPHNLELAFEYDLSEEDSGEKFKQLQQLAETTRYEKDAVESIILCDGISPSEKVDYLLTKVYEGLLDLDLIVRILTDSSRAKRLVSEDDIEIGREKATISLELLQRLPINPTPQIGEYLFDRLNDVAFFALLRSTKRAEFDRRNKELGVDGKNELMSASQSVIDQTDIFEGLNEVEKARAQFEFVLAFINQGGVVSLSGSTKESWNQNQRDDRYVFWSGLSNIGAQVDILGIVERMGFPAEYVKQKVGEMLIANDHRFSIVERDKWVSLIAYCQQPNLLHTRQYVASWEKDEDYFELKVGEGPVKYDAKDVDAVHTVLDHVLTMPKCSYRDQCIGLVFDVAHRAVKYRVSNTDYHDPRAQKLEQRIEIVLATQLSDQAYGVYHGVEPVSDTGKIDRYYFPPSEKLMGDIGAGLYVRGSKAATMWEKLVGQYSDGELSSVFGQQNRDTEPLVKNGEEVTELTILSDRLKVVDQMPRSEVRDALILYSLQTFFDQTQKDDLFGHAENFLEHIVKYERQVVSYQVLEGLFDLHLSVLMGCSVSEIDSARVLENFPQRSDFLGFIVEHLPEKTSFRDSYILLASESYPLQVSEANQIRELLFSTDYGTQNEKVRARRGGLEFARTLKQSEKYDPSQARELMLWMLDEDLQARSIDDYLRKINSSESGKKLLVSALKEMNILPPSSEGEASSVREKIGTHAISLLIEVVLRMPLAIKKKIAKRIIRSTQNDERKLNFVTRAGMPKILESLSNHWLIASRADLITFNSLLDSTNMRNPTTKTVFFDLMLGEKGLLEEPVVHDHEHFRERMDDGFKHSEMHGFVDDIISVVVKKGTLKKREEEVMRVVSHSLLESMSPPRRATVLHELMTEMRAIDFTQSDKDKLRSQIFTVALASFGVLGAKLGQTDELIPESWAGSAASLKHSTRSMPKLAVADIFYQEGLSGDYTITAPAGAASTACGYVISNPSGEHQFVKVVRPEVILRWSEDFNSVEYMLKVLGSMDILSFDPSSVIQQLRRLVEEEIQTGRELDNVVTYASAESDEERIQRKGIRPVKTSLGRIGESGELVDRQEQSLLIFSELLGKQNGFIELAKIKSDPALREQYDLDQINRRIVSDFLFRSLELGNWHADPHEGNIMVGMNGEVTREVDENDLVWIDFGQIGTLEGEERRSNAARFLVGLGLYDREAVAESIFEAIIDKSGISVQTIKSELAASPRQLQRSATKVLAKYKVEGYLTNFLKATINILPYLHELPREEQFLMIAPYIPPDIRSKTRTRLIERLVGNRG